MTDRTVRSICQRLSLRTPQADALEILADVLTRIAAARDTDLAAALAVIRDFYPTVQEFEHAFPSLCFALATGFGKTHHI